jgi:hypothetical protein
MRRLILSLLLILVPAPGLALLVTDFGVLGGGGDVNGQLFRLGTAGQVHELDAFLHIAGPGGDPSVQLSGGLQGPLLDWAPTFSADLYGSGSILLTYEFRNLSGLPGGITFLSFLDAEIAEPGNTFFNEFATVSGVVSPGQGFEIDEPGFTTGDIFDHLLAGALDGTNARPAGSPDDVSMALSFDLGPIAVGDRARIELLISESGDSLGGIVLTHLDALDSTAITFSGRASIVPVPEPATALLLGLGLGVLAAQRRGER